MRSSIFIICFILFLGISGTAQNPVLENYIRAGLESNRALKQKQLDYTKSLYALKESRGLFFPDVSINARYTVADGGRVISFPVGDLLNPVYSTLNMLTASEQFPQIDNEEFSFYRPKEHETKVTLVQPIYNSDIIQSARIKKEYVSLVEVDVDQYRRELIREIKGSYYDYIKAWHLNNLVDSTLKLVEENLRVSRSLFKNDKVTIDVVYRSEAEVSKVEVEKARAKGMLQSAESYFNFLINRSLNESIEIFNEEPELPAIQIEQVQDNAVANREELDKIKVSKSINTHKLSMERGDATPDLFGTVDYGFQGEEYSFTQDDDFVLASVVLRWHLFQGFNNRNKIQQTKIEGEKLDVLLDETENQIKLQVINTYYELLAAYSAIEAERKHVKAAERAFRFLQRRYSEDQATLLEFIDARTSYTNAESRLIIALNEYFLRMAEFEYAAALVDVSKYSD